MSTLTQPRRSVAAVFMTGRLDGKAATVRAPFNIVNLDYGDGIPRSFIEPAGALVRQPSPDDANSGVDASMCAEVYDEVRTYDGPPFPRTRLGVTIL